MDKVFINGDPPPIRPFPQSLVPLPQKVRQPGREPLIMVLVSWEVIAGKKGSRRVVVASWSLGFGSWILTFEFKKHSV